MNTGAIEQGVPGFRFAGVAAGIKSGGRSDLGVIVSDRPCAVAGVFTRNRVTAAPVKIGKRRVRRGSARAVVVNSGNANACTGSAGVAAAEETCNCAGRLLQCAPTEIIPCSTGVIGVPLPVDRLNAALPRVIAQARPDAALEFAGAIMTTDTRPKSICLETRAGGQRVRLLGMAKGAGMIRPEMATMLAFLVTDAAVEPAVLRDLIRTANESSFNRISVDGDMSTNDTALVLANGDSSRLTPAACATHRDALAALLDHAMRDLALQIVRDGEGATKCILIDVRTARSRRDAERAARAVAGSLLVKTAFYGEDFNWGRILAVLGASGARFDPEQVAIDFNAVPAVRQGCGVAANIDRLQQIMREATIRLTINLHGGQGRFEMATCDLSNEYVRINADYTT